MAGLGDGGGGSGAIRAGKASVEVGVDDKGVKTGLGKVQGQFKSFAKQIKDFVPEGGGIGKWFGLAARGGAVGIGVGAMMPLIEQIKNGIRDWATSAKEFNVELERSNKLTGELARLTARRFAREDKETGKLPAEDRIGKIEADLRQAEMESSGSEANLKAARQAAKLADHSVKNRRERGESVVGGIIGSGAARFGFFSGEQAAADAAVKAAEAMHAANRERIALLHAEKRVAEEEAKLNKQRQIAADELLSFNQRLRKGSSLLGNTIGAIVKDVSSAMREAEAKRDHELDVERFFMKRSTNPLLRMTGAVLNDPRVGGAMEWIEKSGTKSMGKLGSLLAMGINSGAMAAALRGPVAAGGMRDAAMGAFATPFASQQFGNLGSRKIEGLTGKIADNTKAAVKALEDMKELMRFV